MKWLAELDYFWWMLMGLTFVALALTFMIIAKTPKDSLAIGKPIQAHSIFIKED